MFDKFVMSTYEKVFWINNKAKRIRNDPPALTAD